MWNRNVGGFPPEWLICHGRDSLSPAMSAAVNSHISQHYPLHAAVAALSLPFLDTAQIQHGVNIKGNTAGSLCKASSSREASSHTQKKPAFHKHKQQYQEHTAEKRENEVTINTTPSAPSDRRQYVIKECSLRPKGPTHKPTWQRQQQQQQQQQQQH